MTNRKSALMSVRNGSLPQLRKPPTDIADTALPQLFELDEVAWLDEMIRLIEEEKHDGLDYQNLKQYLQDMAQRDRREAKSRLIQLIAHLLKWEHQPRKRSRSWESTIAQQRFELEDMLTSKTLANHVQDKMADIYRKAVTIAMKETGLDRKDFPASCPYSLSYLLGEDLPLKKKT